MSAVLDDDVFLGFQPIMGRSRELVAYELLVHPGGADRPTAPDHAAAVAKVIRHAFSSLGMEAALGSKKGFVGLSPAMLMSDVVDVLPPDRIVIEIADHAAATPALIDRCRALQEMGYDLALDDVVALTDAGRELLPYITYMKVDIATLSEPALDALAQELLGHRRRLVAGAVETIEQYDRCRALKFDLFQGNFFTRPSVITGRAVQPSTVLLFKVLRLITGDAEVAELEEALRKAPDVMLRVLRMANAIAEERVNDIYSFRNAIMVLGRSQIGRIVQMMLFAQDKQPEMDRDPLVQAAVMRGRLMELVAESLHLVQVRDRAFMVGVLSLADALFSQPMPEVLRILKLEKPLQDALLRREGQLGVLLNLLEATETGDGTAFRAAANGLGLRDIAAFNRWHIAALQWAAHL